jgi:hypothetical protein
VHASLILGATVNMQLDVRGLACLGRPGRRIFFVSCICAGAAGHPHPCDPDSRHLSAQGGGSWTATVQDARERKLPIDRQRETLSGLHSLAEDGERQ